MKRTFNVFIKIAAAITTVAISIVAIRRFFIDLQDMLGFKILLVKNDSRTKSNLATHSRELHRGILAELMQPLEAGGLPLGVINHKTAWNSLKHELAALPAKSRNKNPHLLVLGSAGTGKTTYLASLIKHDIQNNDRAVLIVDADGALADDIINWMASHAQGESFANRTLVLEPGNRYCKLGFDPFKKDPDRSLQSMATSVVAAFRSITREVPGSQSQFNAQSANILRNSTMLLAANEKSLADLNLLLCDNDYRDTLLASVEKRKSESPEYPLLLDTWGQYRKLARTDQWITWVEPILTRVGAALGDKRISEIFTRQPNEIDLREIIAKKQILIAKFDASLESTLLGSLIISQLKEASSCADETTERNLVAVYVDQLECFLSNTAFELLTGDSWKNRIGLIGAIQNLSALPVDFRDRLLSVVGTINCFSLDLKDAELVAPALFNMGSVRGSGPSVKSSGRIEDRMMNSSEEEVWTEIERLTHQEPLHFHCFRTKTVGSLLEMQIGEQDKFDDQKINKDLLKRILSNSSLAARQN